MSRPARAYLLTAVLAGLAARPSSAEIGVGEGAKLKLYGDMRLRAESDWDSRQSNGAKREDRDRLRARLRLGFNYAYNEHLLLGARARTGTPQDQQSPHQTLGDEFETKGINIDKAFIHGSWGPGWTWVGKNSFPFWTPSEFFWDEDVNPEGVAVGCSFPLGADRFRLKPVLGYFIMEGSGSSNRYKDKASLAAAQLALEAGFQLADVTAAAGVFAFKDNPATVDTALADLDYNLWLLGAKAVFKVAPKPLSLGFDFMRNARTYSPSLFNRSEKTGYALSLNLGRLKEKRDWLVGYYYARVEKFAVVARLAQDDWLRWGSATDTRSSNFKGHEFRLGYVLGPSLNMLARFYLVDALQPESAAAVSKEDGKRFRLDLNLSF